MACHARASQSQETRRDNPTAKMSGEETADRSKDGYQSECAQSSQLDCNLFPLQPH